MHLDKIWNLLSNKIYSWFELSIKGLPNFIVAILVLIVFYLLAKFAQKAVQKILMRVTFSKSVQNLISSVTYLGVLLIGLFIALGILNLDKTVTSLLAGAGVLGLALGFAFQDIASNFVSGIFIALKQPYKLGDIIESGSYLGKVTAINLRTTTVTTFQGLEVLIPNKMLFTDPVTNYTNKPERRLDVVVGVSYGDDLEKVEKLLAKELESLPNRIKHHPIDVFFCGFGDSSINLEVHVWVEYPNHRNFLITQSAAIKKIKNVFDRNDITIPFPIRTLDFGIKGGEKLSQMPISYKQHSLSNSN